MFYKILYMVVLLIEEIIIFRIHIQEPLNYAYLAHLKYNKHVFWEVLITQPKQIAFIFFNQLKHKSMTRNLTKRMKNSKCLVLFRTISLVLSKIQI